MLQQLKRWWSSRKLRSANPYVRAAGVAALADSGDPLAARELLGVLGDPLPLLRTCGAQGLARLRSQEAVPALVRTLADPDEGVRREALSALGVIDPRWAERPDIRPLIPELIAGLNRAPARAGAASALGRIRQPEVVSALIDVVPVGDPELYRLVYVTLTENDPNWPRTAAGRAALPRIRSGLQDPKVRLQAVELLEAAADTDAVAPLILLTAEADGDLRRAAAKALQTVDPEWPRGPAARAVAPDLVRRLQDPATREPAGAALRLIGDVAVVPLLIEHLLVADPLVSGAARDLLGVIDPDWRSSAHAGAALPRILQSITESDPETGGRKVELVVEIRGAAAVPDLLPLLLHPAGSVRGGAAGGLDRIAPEWSRTPAALGAVPGFVHALTLTGHLPAAAAAALERIGTADAVPLLLNLPLNLAPAAQAVVGRALDGSDPAWRTSAVAQEALAAALAGPLNGRRFVPAWVVQVAAVISGDNLHAAFDLLRRAATARVVPVCSAVRDGIFEVAGRRPAGLVEFLRSDDALVRETAAAATGRVPAEFDPELQLGPALVVALGDTDRFVRIAAARALGRGRHDAAVGPLVALFEQSNDSRLHETAAEALGIVGDAGAEAALLRLLGRRDADGARQAAAVRALLALRGEEVIDQLLDVAISPFSSPIDPYVYDALVRCGRAASTPNTATVIRMRIAYASWRERIAQAQVVPLARRLAEIYRRGSGIEVVAFQARVRQDLIDAGFEPEDLLRELDLLPEQFNGSNFGSVDAHGVAEDWGIGGSWRR